MKGAKLGFIALTDAAPLFVAKEKGFFAKYGMPDVEVLKQASWGATRDNLVLGGEGNGIDGAHILTPMPYLISRRQGDAEQRADADVHPGAAQSRTASASRSPRNTPTSRSASTPSRSRQRSRRRRRPARPIKAAMTFPGGTHDLWIRYWLAAGGIDPDKDIETIVVPPPQMVANMKVGTMDCFCVCEPWNLQLINQNIGYTAITTGELWNKHPGEVARHARRLRRQVSERRQGAADGGDGSAAVVRQAGEPRRGRGDLRQAAMDQRARSRTSPTASRASSTTAFPARWSRTAPHIMKYWKDHASYPFQSHDLWFITEDIRWGKFEPGYDAKALINKVNREDLWREAAKALGVAAADIPTSTSRGKETFFDGKVFDPENPAAYLKSLAHQARRSRDARRAARLTAARFLQRTESICTMNMPFSRPRRGSDRHAGSPGAKVLADLPPKRSRVHARRLAAALRRDARSARRAAGHRHRARCCCSGSCSAASRARRCRRPRKSSTTPGN